MADELIAERRGPALILTINRPERRNAMTADVIRALTAAVTAVDGAETRLAVLTGTPPAFCAGGDLRFGMSVAREGGLPPQSWCTSPAMPASGRCTTAPCPSSPPSTARLSAVG